MKRIIVLLVVICLFACTHKKDVDVSKLKGNLKALTEAIAEHPDNAELYFYRAQYYYDNKKIKPAQADAAQAIKLDPAQAKYYVLLSDTYFAEKETDLAEENLQKAIQLDSKYNEARTKLAELYFYERMYNECMTTIDEATKISPHNPTAYLIKAFCYKDLGDTTNYLKMLYLVKDQDSKEIKAELELGHYYQLKNDPQAIAHYHNALLLDPNNQEISYNLAQMYVTTGNLEKAKEQYNIVLQISNKGTYAKHTLYNLAYISMVAQNYAETINYCTKAIALDPSFIEAYELRGESYQRQKEKEKARADYEYCIKLKPDYQPALDGLKSL